MRQVTILLSLCTVFLLGCQSNQVKVSKADAEQAYFKCVYSQYDMAVSKGVQGNGPAIDAALDACKDDVMNLAMIFAREYHMRADKHYEHATMTYAPLIEKNTRKSLMDYLK